MDTLAGCITSPLCVQQSLRGSQVEEIEVRSRRQQEAQASVVFDWLNLVRLIQPATPQVKVIVKPTVLPDIRPLTAGEDGPPSLTREAIRQRSFAEVMLSSPCKL